MLTADTITAEQIQSLWPKVPWDPMYEVVMQASYSDDVCLRHIELSWRRTAARAHRAEILNARNAKAAP